MYNKLFSVFGLASVLFLISCEKVIDVQLNEADKKYVIEGTVSNIAGSPAEVRISQTKAFNENSNFTGITGAVVTIQLNNSTTYTLSETAAGIYKSSAFTGIPGNTYSLKVKIGTAEFTSVCTMPLQLVLLDTVTVDNFAFGGSSSKILVPSYQDPAGKGNSYRFIQYNNAIQVKQVFVYNDDLSDGLRSTRPLANPGATSNEELKAGDIARVDMFCIAPEVYKYWYSLDQAATGSSSATPANPVTNIVGGALGYFSAHSVSSKTIRVP
ncbi:MAG: DUF4249 domain-containing protein [Chitinophagaceae bacterium]|nr:DUF4249 domain-containing protein [Chitinophagaceae bacterium]